MTIKPEIEATFININKAELVAKLQRLGAICKQPETLMRRTIFDMGPNRFARVRDEGNRITMSYKQVDDLSLSGTKEICLNINNYDDGIEMLKAFGLKPKALQESRREEWVLNDVEIDIDTWPWIPTYVELEGPSEAAVKDVATLLGFDMQDARYGSVDQIYKIYYNVTSDDINYCPEIKFTDVPEWLASKKKSK